MASSLRRNHFFCSSYFNKAKRNQVHLAAAGSVEGAFKILVTREQEVEVSDLRSILWTIKAS